MRKLLTFLFILAAGMSFSFGQVLLDNFQDTRQGDYGFINGVFIPYFENPDQSGVNTSLVAAQYTRNTVELFDVIILDVDMADLSDYVSGSKTMSMDVWSPAVGTTVQITLENKTLAQPANFPTGRHSIYLATTTTANAWETITFAFDSQPDATVSSTDVDRFILLFAPNTNDGSTYYFDNVMGPEFRNDPCDGVSPNANVLNDFECNQNLSYTFSHAGVNFRRVANPDMNGNTSSHVGSYTRNPGEEFDVMVGRTNGNLNINATSQITVDVWDPGAPTTVILSLQFNDGLGNTTTVLDTPEVTVGSNAWETLTFDVGAAAGQTVNQVVLLFDPGDFTSDNYFFDNVILTNSVSIDDLIEAGSFNVWPNPATDVVNFGYELKGSSEVALTIVDAFGRTVGAVNGSTQRPGMNQLQFDASNLSRGIYYYQLNIDGAETAGKLILGN